jgi:hypothetical protein
MSHWRKNTSYYRKGTYRLNGEKLPKGEAKEAHTAVLAGDKELLLTLNKIALKYVDKIEYWIVVWC